MELTKFSTGGEILAHIRHDLRQIPEGKSYGNESVDPELSKTNYSLIDRGKTAKEVNQYRKAFEKECFKYNRKNLVHSVELVIQCPSDCPQEQHREFFQTAFDWYCDKYLPAGKDCVFVAEIHRDEHKFITIFENGKEVKKDISREHLHILYVPAVEAGSKYPDFKYRLNADQLTKRAILRDMHPSLQKELEAKGITATVYSKKPSDGKTIGLSVKQLKEITKKYGITIDHSITIDELAGIIQKNVELQKNEVNVKHVTEVLTTKLHAVEQELDATKKELSYTKEELQTIQHNQSVSTTNTEAKDKQIEALQQQVSQLQEKLLSVEQNKTIELAAKDQEIEQLKSKTMSQDTTKEWGSVSDWGKPQQGWGKIEKGDKSWTIDK